MLYPGPSYRKKSGGRMFHRGEVVPPPFVTMYAYACMQWPCNAWNQPDQRSSAMESPCSGCRWDSSRSWCRMVSRWRSWGWWRWNQLQRGRGRRLHDLRSAAQCTAVRKLERCESGASLPKSRSSSDLHELTQQRQSQQSVGGHGHPRLDHALPEQAATAHTQGATSVYALVYACMHEPQQLTCCTRAAPPTSCAGMGDWSRSASGGLSIMVVQSRPRPTPWRERADPSQSCGGRGSHSWRPRGGGETRWRLGGCQLPVVCKTLFCSVEQN